MQRKVVLLFLFITFSGYSQKSYQKTYDNNGQLIEEGWLMDKTKTDYWIFYYSDGSKQKEGHFKNNKAIKYWYFYNKNLKIDKEGHYIEGKKSGWWLFYDEAENLNFKCQFEKDQKNGYCILYLKNKVMKIEKYIAGNKIDEWIDLKSFKKENKLSELQ